jgi:hypothetical protein
MKIWRQHVNEGRPVLMESQMALLEKSHDDFSIKS